MKELRLEYPEDLGPVEVELRIKIGDAVKRGDIFALISTDKATLELEAFEPFTLRAIRPTDRGLVLTIDDA